MTRIVIANQKGGVGKTTTAVALAHGLALADYSVVLVDLDAQGNAAPCLGLPPRPALSQIIHGLTPMENALIEARPNLWFLASDTTTADLKNYIASQMYNREKALARALESITADFVVIDTGPSKDILHLNAHFAGDLVVIPAKVDHLALIGVAQEFESLHQVREAGHAVEVVAVLPTFYDRVTNESHTNLAALVEQFGDLVLPPIPKTVRLREAPAYGKTVWEYLREGHRARHAYERLQERVLA